MNMLNTVLALAMMAGTTNGLSKREAMVEEINNTPGVTWKAAVSDKFKDLPLGATNIIYGARLSNRTAAEPVRLNDTDFPESFDSATEWPECAKVIGDIRDQSNCGCCWAFGAAESASDRACIATKGEILAPFSAQDVCFNAPNKGTDGCQGNDLYTPWDFIHRYGVVTGGQTWYDEASPKSDPFDDERDSFCASFSMPHCFHHGPENDSPYPAENEPGCPSQTAPNNGFGFDACDANSTVKSYSGDKYTFDGSVTDFFGEDKMMESIMTDGPLEAAFVVYEDFEAYAGGIYSHVTGANIGGHAVKIVGWGVEDGTKYWKIANSWNPYWGEDGYFRILKGVNECEVESEAYGPTLGSTWSKMN